MTMYRRRNPNVAAFRWGHPAPVSVPLWLATHVEMIFPDGRLLLKATAGRQSVEPGSWIVFEAGTPIRVLEDDEFQQTYEEMTRG